MAFTTLFYCLFVFAWGTLLPQIFRPNLIYPIGSYGHMFSRVKEIQDFKNVDILITGSSHAYRGFDTRNFEKEGYSCFNLSSSYQTPIQTKVLLKRYLDHLNPRTIIFEVYPATFSIDGVESSLNIIANDRNDLSSIKMATDINNIKTYNTLLYGLFRDLFKMNSSFVEPSQKGDDTYISGGYVEKKPFTFKHINYKEQYWGFYKKQYDNFEEILSMIKKKNIKLILVNAPLTPALYNSYANNDKFDSIMRAYGTYYNFNELLTLDDSLHFFDADHLNQYGVAVFNKKLIEILKGELGKNTER